MRDITTAETIDQIETDLRGAVAGYHHDAAERRNAGDDRMAGFYEHLADLAQRRLDRAMPALVHVATAGIGCTLKSHQREQWATFLHDASSPGSFRYQLYDARGFFSHSTHSTLAAAVADAVDNGYTVPDDGAPDRIMATPEFERGNRIASLVQQVNAGILTHDEANARVAAMDAEYATRSVTSSLPSRADS